MGTQAQMGIAEETKGLGRMTGEKSGWPEAALRVSPVTVFVVLLRLPLRLPPQHNNGDEDGTFSRGVTAHNFFAMSCIGLAPPPPFLPVPGRPPVPWPQWHQMFENFLLASGASDFKPERGKALKPRR
ncbi:hypothetical protein HPB50_027273 [Hyalomma asiaticum]|uniref:Uncharacterized protein n=1 Tax=Hyalomma asiaticum TaxID=266040 RepID=A0ACB7TQ90_HYAAI|nr:hypothetical protein HPB50_027273 [Hyalomma asiaticum]